jgi:hypothetical protein
MMDSAAGINNRQKEPPGYEVMVVMPSSAERTWPLELAAKEHKRRKEEVPFGVKCAV